MSIIAPIMETIWGFFQINIPMTNMTFADLYLGIIIVSLAMVILRQLLSLEIGGFRSIHFKSGKNIHKYNHNDKSRENDEK